MSSYLRSYERTQALLLRLQRTALANPTGWLRYASKRDPALVSSLQALTVAELDETLQKWEAGRAQVVISNETEYFWALAFVTMRALQLHRRRN